MCIKGAMTKFVSVYDFLEDWLQRLRESDMIVVVEGREDKAALEHFDIPHVKVLYRDPMFTLCEEIVHSGKGVVFLTDLDAEGKRLYAKLYRELDRYGVHINKVFREELFKHTQLRQIEGLVRYFAREKEKAGKE